MTPTAPLRQAIAVIPYTRMGTLAVAACASTKLLTRNLKSVHEDTSVWYTWLDQDYGKLVKKASPRHIQELQSWAYDHHIDVETYSIGIDTALAFPPMPADQLPPRFRKLQLTGWSCPVDTDNIQLYDPKPSHWMTPRHPSVIIRIDSSLQLPTGKAAAHAAHALNHAVLHHERLTDIHIVEKPLTPQDIASADIIIDDNGYTVVEAGTTTATVHFIP